MPKRKRIIKSGKVIRQTETNDDGTKSDYYIEEKHVDGVVKIWRLMIPNNRDTTIGWACAMCHPEIPSYDSPHWIRRDEVPCNIARETFRFSGERYYAMSEGNKIETPVGHARIHHRSEYPTYICECGGEYNRNINMKSHQKHCQIHKTAKKATAAAKTEAKTPKTSTKTEAKTAVKTEAKAANTSKKAKVTYAPQATDEARVMQCLIPATDNLDDYNDTDWRKEWNRIFPDEYDEI